MRSLMEALLIKTVVDVGANLGHWTNSIYSLLNPNVIICYEPVFDTFELLKKNVKGKKIDCRRSAVGSFNGSVKINVEKKHQMSSILEIHESTKKLYGMQSKTKSEEAKIVKLDDDLKDIKEISLLKIDVQGYEKQVLEGARNILKVTNMLIVEILYVSHYKKDYCAIDLMKEITEKYDFNLWVVTPANKDNNNRPIFADAIFIKKGIDA